MDELNKAQEQIAEKVGKLLAESPLDEDVKEVLLEGIDKLPKELMFKLWDSLENEKEGLEKLAFEVRLFLKEQDANWEQTASEQKKTADIIADVWFEKLK